jgi:hypothetical protein
MASYDRRVEKSPPQQHMVIQFRRHQKFSAVEKKSTTGVLNKRIFRLVHVLVLVAGTRNQQHVLGYGVFGTALSR